MAIFKELRCRNCNAVIMGIISPELFFRHFTEKKFTMNERSVIVNCKKCNRPNFFDRSMIAHELRRTKKEIDDSKLLLKTG